MSILNLLRDTFGTPFPQFLKRDESACELLKGSNGAMDVNVKDGVGGVNSLAVAADGSIKALLLAPDGAITTLGSKGDAAVIDPALNASELSLLKGLLKQLQGNGTGAENVKIKDSVGVNTLAVSTAGAASVNIINSIEAVINAPVVGVKTIVATAAEVFAGASAKANRRTLSIKNEDAVLRFRIGPLTVNQQTGFPIEPGATVKIKFDPSIATQIYAISEGASLPATVWEE